MLRPTEWGKYNSHVNVIDSGFFHSRMADGLIEKSFGRQSPSRQRRLFPLFLLLLILIVGLLSSPSWATPAAPVITLGTEQHKRVLGAAEVDWLRDPSGVLSIDQIDSAELKSRFQPLTKGMNFGFTRDAIWLRITLARTADAPQVWRLELNVPYMNDVRFHTPTPNGFGISQAGDRFPFVERPALPQSALPDCSD